MSNYRRRSKRQARTTRSLPTITIKRGRIKQPGTSLSRLARLTVHAAARDFRKPRVVFKTTPRTKSAPYKLTLRDQPKKPTGSWREPATLIAAKQKLNLCERKARRRAVIMALSNGRGVKAPGPYRKHTEPCK